MPQVPVDAGAMNRGTDAVARLRAAGCVFAEEEADLLREAASERSTVNASLFEALLRRRIAGEPLEQVLGWVAFAGARYAVAPGVFVPRRRTELLVEAAAGLLEGGDGAAGGARGAGGRVVVELCAGVAAVAAALAARLPDVEVWAADLDPAAVAVARRNLRPDRVVLGDLFDALPPSLRGRVDVLVANAPYVPTDEIALMPPEARDHEAMLALDGGADGLDLHRRITASAASWLAPGGALLIETSRRQAATTAALAEAGGLRTEILRDDDRDATAVLARPPLAG